MSSREIVCPAPPDDVGFPKEKPLNRNMLKYLVIIAMTIDHIAWGFVDQTHPLAGGIMHVFGRLTGPTMAFFLAEGYHFTKDPARYQLRLFLFALISWIPYDLFEFGRISVNQSVIFTLFLGITALRVWDSGRFDRETKIALIILLTTLSWIGDWAIMDVLAPLFLHVFRNDKKRRYLSLFLLYAGFPVIQVIGNPSRGWFQFGVLLVPALLIGCYNGKPGKKTAFHKWFFYIYYPAHLLVLALFRWWI